MGVNQAKLEDHYYLQKVKLGQGSFGTVWRAVDRKTGKETVAIKQIDKSAMPKRGVKRQDIEREVSVMQACNHENVTRLLNHFEDDRSIYLALEYCDGGDFGDKVKEKAKTLTEKEAVDWMWQISSAILVLHSQDICHRDIKPDNFMVAGETVKLSDFGLAMFLPKGRLVTDKCGTPAFMAPEQHGLPKHSRGYGLPVDMWAAGVTMYMLLVAGRHPFIDSRGNLDQKRMANGTLDFAVTDGFFGFGATPCRFSAAAQGLCKRMVEPNSKRRLTAKDAMQDHWLQQSGKLIGAMPPRPPPVQHKAQDGAWWQNTPMQDVFEQGSQAMAIVLEQAKQAMAPEEKSEPGSQSEKVKVLEEQLAEAQHQLKQQRTTALLELEPSAGSDRVANPFESRDEKPSAELTIPKTLVPPDQGRLPRGMKCLYNSATHSTWMPAIIECFNDSDGTYDLNVRKNAELWRISPCHNVSKSEAWPTGTHVSYESKSVDRWLPAMVVSFNESTGESQGTYNLDVRDCAPCEKIRPRLRPDSTLV